MNYYDLKSIFSASKTYFELNAKGESLYIAEQRDKPYIEPVLAKVVGFEKEEKPKVILVSAVGATGKTALAQVLSNQSGLPILDLSKHKPVGDNTLTGIVTTSFKTSDLSQILLGFASSTYGMIIDGVDEGRSKTTEKAFEAFLDNICQLCGNSSDGTSFLLLGRTQILEDCWLYFAEKEISTGLISILPFDTGSAQKYIDQYADVDKSKNFTQYCEARDYILKMLGNAFISKDNNDFLSFIGYPPVLDAIVTLLSEEKNYYKLLSQIQNSDERDLEIELLIKIADYILEREKEQKVNVNILNSLVSDMPASRQKQIIDDAFESEEQCVRLIAHILNRDINLQVIEEQFVNERYEEALKSWIPEHPFISGKSFRNVVFEAIALSKLMISKRHECKQMVLEYLHTRRYTYHLIYLLSVFAKDHNLPADYLHVLIGSALEFISPNTSVEINVGEELDLEEELPTAFSIEIEILLGRDQSATKTFNFKSSLDGQTTVSLGNRLANTFISLPCAINLDGGQEIEITAPVEILANNINANAKSLILHHPPLKDKGKEKEKDVSADVVFHAHVIESNLESIATNGVKLSLVVDEIGALTYPAIQYAQKREKLPSEPQVKEKYIRLRKILMQFRSHSKGTLAKYKEKIEHERVLKNKLGYAILQKLLSDKIITLTGVMYFLEPDEISKHLGVSYIDLRTGKTSEKLIQYLQAIKSK